MIFGELWTAGASHAGDSFSLSLRKMGTPRLAMRMGAVLEDEACHKDISIGIGRGVFISGNKQTIILFRETGVPELNLDRELQLTALNNPV